MSPVRARVWDGAKFVDEGDFEEPFIIGTTMPQSTLINASALPTIFKTLCGNADTAGLLPDVELSVFTDFAGTNGGRKIINGSSSVSDPLVISNKIIYGPVMQATSASLGNVKFVNCFFTMNAPWTQTSGGAGPAYVGLADARSNAGTARWTFERCHFDPTEEFAHPGISAIMGHHVTAIRCTWQRVVDGYSGYRVNTDPSSVLAAEILGCINIWNSFFWDATAGIVHTSDYKTHNDFIQIQGGGVGDGYTYALDARGNLVLGYNFLADGVTIAASGLTNVHDQSRHLNHQGVLLQQNQWKGVAITSRVSNNWVGGCAQPFTFKTSAGANTSTEGGTPYNVIMEGNRLIDDDHKLEGSSGVTDPYGVAGGTVFHTRLQPSVLVNDQGTSTYPADFTARLQNEGDNRYADLANIHANRRGQLMHIRRDSTWV